MLLVYRRNVATRAFTCAVAVFLFDLTASGEQGPVNWNQFRGPNGQGVCQADRVPVRFGPDSNVLWKTPVPPGQSSPVIWGDRIFFTACEPRSWRKLIALCIDRRNGKILWRQVTPTGKRARYHPMNGPASPTPAADREHLYVYFPTWGLLCYDHRGRNIWQRKLETPKNDFGVATSPILYKDKVILLLDDNGGNSRLFALKRRTGETAWEQSRPLFKQGWSTPMIWRHGDTDELIVLGFKRLTSYDPSTGEEIWWAGGFSRETIGVPVAGQGLVFVGAAAVAGRGDDKWDAPRTWNITLQRFDRNKDKQIQRDEMTKGFTIILRPELAKDNPGYGVPIGDMDGLMRYFDKDKNRVITEAEWMRTMSGFATESQPTLLAIRPGAEGDARRSHVVWEAHRGLPESPSILYCRKRLYLLRDGGLLTCLEAATGKEIFREKIGARGQYGASPIAAGDKIITASVRGTVTVIQVDDKLQVLARNDFKEKIFATPALAENKIYLRTNRHLYALGE